MIGSSLLTPRAAKSDVRQGIVGVTKKRGTEALSTTLASLLVSPGLADSWTRQFGSCELVGVPRTFGGHERAQFIKA
jgi:hypothetical protein